MKATLVRAAIAAVGVVIAAAAARRNPPPPEEPPRAVRPPAAVEARSEDPAPPAPQRPKTDAFGVPAEVPRDEPEFWDGMGVLLATKTGPGDAELRRAVIELTLRYLGWTDSRRPAFASAAEAAAREVEDAWSVREGRLSDGPDETAHDRYVQCKKLSLARLDLMLDPSQDPERRLLERLEEWFDAIR